jgi:hypothetical protein
MFCRIAIAAANSRTCNATTSAVRGADDSATIAVINAMAAMSVVTQIQLKRI